MGGYCRVGIPAVAARTLPEVSGGLESAAGAGEAIGFLRAPLEKGAHRLQLLHGGRAWRTARKQRKETAWTRCTQHLGLSQAQGCFAAVT